jgi:hypothetical protein
MQTGATAMATQKHYNGATELKGVFSSGNKLFGQPIDFVPIFVPGVGWDRGYVPVDRTITYKSNPLRHDCDARCMNATGRIMQCECSCGGKNHGRGAFNCS